MVPKWAIQKLSMGVIQKINGNNVSLVSSTHVMRVACENNDNQILNNFNKFWDLDSIGIKDNERAKSVWKF